MTVVVSLYGYIAVKGLKAGFQAVVQDKAFQFFLLSGFIYLTVIAISLMVSFAYTSIFISRYMWPSQLLIMYQLVYAVYFFTGQRTVDRRLIKLLPVYAMLLGGLIFYKVWKMKSSFQSEVLTYLPNDKSQLPIFVERADYFLPIWYHKARPNVSFLLNWSTATRSNNLLSAVIDYKVLSQLKEQYGLEGIVPTSQFDAAHFPHFYVDDDQAIYQIEDYIKRGRVRVVQELPIDMPGHRLLECVFLTSDAADNEQTLPNSAYKKSVYNNQ